MRLSFFFPLLLSPIILFAAEQPTNVGTFWFNVGVGFGGIFNDSVLVEEEKSGSAFTVSANVATFDNQLMTLRASTTNGDVYYAYPDGNHGRLAQDIALMYGWMYKNDIFLGSIAGGLAYTSLEVIDQRNPSDDHYLLGYPLEAQVFWTPTDYLGIGLIGVANINSESSFASALFGFQFGKLQ